MIKNKIKIIAATLTAAILLVAGSSLTSSFAYFGDKATGFVQSFRVPNTSYKVAAYWDERDMSPVSYNGENEYYVKIKNTGNVDMTFMISTPSGDVSQEVNVGAGQQMVCQFPYEGGAYSSLTRVVDLEIRLVSISDGEQSYPYEDWNMKSLSLYAE